MESKWKKFKSHLKKDHLIIALLCGVLLVVIAIPTSTSKEETQAESDTSTAQTDPLKNTYIEEVETKLEQTLSKVEGVGNVSVMVTLQASAEKVTQKDSETTDETITESDSQGGNRTTQNRSETNTTIYESNGDGSLSSEGNPYVIKELSPVIEGVVVIADGGDNAVVIREISDAVRALFNIDTHKIKIMKRSEKK